MTDRMGAASGRSGLESCAAVRSPIDNGFQSPPASDRFDAAAGSRRLRDKRTGTSVPDGCVAPRLLVANRSSKVGACLDAEDSESVCSVFSVLSISGGAETGSLGIEGRTDEFFGGNPTDI